MIRETKTITKDSLESSIYHRTIKSFEKDSVLLSEQLYRSIDKLQSFKNLSLL